MKRTLVTLLCAVTITGSLFAGEKSLSREFTKAGIRAIEMIKAVEYAAPPSQSASEIQQNEARKALVDAKLAINNDADKSAHLLLADTFQLRELAVVDSRDPNNIDSWERDAKAMQQCFAEAIAVIDPDSLPKEWRERAAAKTCVAMHDNIVAEIMNQK